MLTYSSRGFSLSRRGGVNRLVTVLTMLALAGAAMLLLYSCRGSSGRGTVQTLQPQSDLPTGNSIALVLEASGAPNVGAVIGGSSVPTNSNGIAIGNVSPTTTGWAKVESSGFASSYARQVGVELLGKKLFLAALTPLGDTEVIDEADPAMVLQISDGTNVVVRADLPTGTFSVDGVKVGLALVAAADGVPIFDLTVGTAQLFLQGGFTIDAADAQGAPVLPSKDVTVTLRDGGELSSGVELAVFDPQSGTWRVLPSAFKRTDPDHVAASVNTVGQFGVFDKKTVTPLWARESSGSEAAAADPTEDAYRSAWYDAQLKLPGNRYPDAEREAAAKAYAQAAQDYAVAHPNETAKMRLLVAGHFIDTWYPNSGIELNDDAAAVWVQLVSTILAADPDCDQLDELMALEAQRQALHSEYVPPDAAEDLQAKIRELELRCKVLWRGTVHYTFHLEDTFPTLKRYEIWPSSQRTWQETHNVSITAEIDPVTGELTERIEGTDFVDVVLLPVMYRYDIKDGTNCGDDHHDIELPMIPAKEITALSFDFLGTLVGEVFTIDDLQLDASRSDTIVIKRRDLIEFWLRDPCRPIKQDTTITAAANYRSMLGTGFMGTAEKPDLATMLNEGTKTTNGDVVTISGRRELMPTLPPAIYPFARATVSWRFMNITKF